MIGKDLTKTCVPVQFNEPISMLQKFAESMEYEDLLVRANNEEDPYVRCMLVAAFGVSRFSSTNNRLDKPFNPLLGETFELVDLRGKYRCISEQVSHHPPISALYAESADYEVWMNSNMKSKLSFKNLEVNVLAYCHVVLKRWNEHYVSKRPRSLVQNILAGKMYMEHVGTMDTTNLTTGSTVAIEFYSKKESLSGDHFIKG